MATTEKQLQILTFIEKEITRSGRPPTYRDIATHFGYEAVGTVQDHVRALIRKGYLEQDTGVARGIRIAHRSTTLQVPILGTVPAGKPIEAIETMMGSLSIPTQVDRSPVTSINSDVYALRVSGESMRDAGILDGDYVIVRKQSQVANGDIVVAMIEGEVTVKTYEKKHGQIRLLPANPKFSPIDLAEQGESAIQGKVIGVQRYF